MAELIKVANEIDVPNAPINIPSLTGCDENTTPPKHVAKGEVDKIRRFRRLPQLNWMRDTLGEGRRREAALELELE